MALDESLEKADAVTRRADIRGPLREGLIAEVDLRANQVVGYTFEVNADAVLEATAYAVNGSSDAVLMLYGPQTAAGAWPKRLLVVDDWYDAPETISQLRLPRAGKYLVLVAEYEGRAGQLTLTIHGTGFVPSPVIEPRPAVTAFTCRTLTPEPLRNSEGDSRPVTSMVTFAIRHFGTDQEELVWPETGDEDSAPFEVTPRDSSFETLWSGSPELSMERRRGMLYIKADDIEIDVATLALYSSSGYSRGYYRLESSEARDFYSRVECTRAFE